MTDFTKPTPEIKADELELGHRLCDALPRNGDGEILESAIRHRFAEIISQERKVKSALAAAIDAASDRLIDVLDHSGSLESESVQRAAYRLRLAVVQAIGDPDRISAAERSLRELDGEGAETPPQPNGPGCVVLVQDVTEEEQESGFMNATLQGAGELVTFSVGTNLAVPDHVVAGGQDAVTAYVSKALSAAATQCEGLSFQVMVGPSRDAVKQGQIHSSAERDR